MIYRSLIVATLAVRFFAVPAQADEPLASLQKLLTDGYELKGMSSAAINDSMRSAFWLQKSKSVYLCVLPTQPTSQIADFDLCAALTK